MNLSLGPDGTATVTEDPGNGTKTLFGHWVDSGIKSRLLSTLRRVSRPNLPWRFNPATMDCRRLPGTTPPGAKRIRHP